MCIHARTHTYRYTYIHTQYINDGDDVGGDDDDFDY